MKFRRLKPKECAWLLPFGIAALIAFNTFIPNHPYGYAGFFLDLLFVFGMLATLIGILGLTHLGSSD